MRQKITITRKEADSKITNAFYAACDGDYNKLFEWEVVKKAILKELFSNKKTLPQQGQGLS